MIELKNWNEITRGLYRYVIGAKVCYEIHVTYWDEGTDILTAKANLYIVGEWRDKDGSCTFERELIVSDRTVQMCLEVAVVDDAENNS